ncbi:MAG: hypothetical protein WC449_05410 [Candidatus Paceibacterota bacterium]
MPKFSDISLLRLADVDSHLVEIFMDIIEWYDCFVMYGKRTPAEQANLRRLGKSKLAVGYHMGRPYHPLTISSTVREVDLTAPACAIDVASYPYKDPITPKDYYPFYHFGGLVQATARKHNIELRWGGDWNRNNNLFDQTFNDLVHFELVV